jgi:hypothetical protein
MVAVALLDESVVLEVVITIADDGVKQEASVKLFAVLFGRWTDLLCQLGQSRVAKISEEALRGNAIGPHERVSREEMASDVGGLSIKPFDQKNLMASTLDNLGVGNPHKRLRVKHGGMLRDGDIEHIIWALKFYNPLVTIHLYVPRFRPCPRQIGALTKKD